LAVPILVDLEPSVTLSPIITLDEAADAVWGAVVVGAGPAGSIAARELSRLGVKTLLVDKATFPRRKVCGCCLNGSALAALESVGLGDLPIRLGGVPLHNVRLAAGGATATLRLPGGVSLSREAFDAALVERALEAGVEFLSGTTAKRNLEPPTRLASSPPSTAEGGGISTVSIRLRHGEVERNIEARVVIAAGGLNGRLDPVDNSVAEPASRIGAGAMLDDADAFYQPGTIFMAVGRGGYVGLVRVEDGRLDVAAAFDPEFVRRRSGLGEAAASVLYESGFPPIKHLAEVPWRGTPALTRSAKQLAGERWFAIGDAAGYVEPFTGEGMAWATTSGAAVAPLAAKASRSWNPAFVHRWEQSYARIIRSRQGMCRSTAALLRSPTATKLVVRVLSALPVLSRPIVAALNRPPRLSLEPTA
jgi:menaquinone-9 beta-reductase